MNPTLTGSERFGYRVRSLAIGDLGDVLQIEQETMERPWTVQRLQKHLADPNFVGLAAESEEGLLGFAVISMEAAVYCVCRLTTALRARRQKVGSALIAEVQHHALRSERLIRVDVPDDALEAHLFFQKSGFVCDGVLQQSELQEGSAAEPDPAAAYRFTWTPYQDLFAEE